MRLLLPLPFMIVSTSSVSVSAFHTTATGSMRPTTRKAGRRKSESSASRRYSTIPGFYDYAGTSSSAVSNEEQENADTYLEFLDQRYNRVHNDESNGWLRRASTPFGKKKKKKKTEQQQEVKATNNDNENTSSSASVFSFCAMDWLMNTGGKHTSTPTSTDTSTSHGNEHTNTMSTSIYDEIVASCTTSRYQRQQQQEAEDDALYILGVAGLASHKLLQKHHLLTTTTTTSSKAVADIDAKKTFLHMETKDSDDDGSESEHENKEGTLPTKEKAMRTAISLTQSYVVKKMIVPFLRVLFYIEGRKQAVKRAVQQRVMETALKPTTKLLVATVVNYYHSWKRYIHRTVAYGSVVLAIIAYNKNTILTSLQS